MQLFSRKILYDIEKWLLEQEFIILNGARQVGKTSLLFLIRDLLKTKHNIEEERIIYLNLEDFDVLAELNEHPRNLLKYIVTPKDKNYFLIDEIQLLDKPSNFLKLLYDKYADTIKIITTGSSTLEIKAKLQDSLVGRKITFDITPLSFLEFLEFKQIKEIDSWKINQETPIEIHQKFLVLLEEYLTYGGLPAVAIQPDKTKKEQLLREYVNTYINKDIRAIGKVENISQFNNIVKTLASQIGNLLNFNELTNTLNINLPTLKKHIDLLQHTFVLFLLKPYYTNVRTQISKMSKVYFFDLGIRNMILNNFLKMEQRSDSGALFENFIFLELKNILSQDEIYFYRTTAKTEIDFVISQNQELTPIEIKYKKLQKTIATNALSFFQQRYKTNKPCLVNLTFNQENKQVNYLDFRLFLNQL